MSDASPVSLVCWDVVGAAAVDDSVLQRAFAEAIATQGVVTGTAAYVRSMVQFDRTRGWPPADVMRILFPEDEIRAQAANLAFERSFQAAVDRFGVLPLPGANDALAKLTAAGIKVCLVSSLSKPALSLDRGTASTGGSVRTWCCARTTWPGASPGPTSSSPRSCGWASATCVTWRWSRPPKAACCRPSGPASRFVVGVLSDVDDASRLRRAGVTHLLADIGELPDLLASQPGGTTTGFTTASD